MQIDENDARLISRAFVVLNEKLVAEYEKIQNTPDVSQLLVEAAHAYYNETIKAYSDLHVKLVEAFPQLR